MALHPQLDELIQHVLPMVQDFHRKSMFAPHAATIDQAGNLSGRALTSDGSAQLSVSQAIEHFETSFAQQASLGEIQAAGIFYHSSGVDTSTGKVSLPPASNTLECRTLVALLEHADGDSVYLLIPYSGDPLRSHTRSASLSRSHPKCLPHRGLKPKSLGGGFGDAHDQNRSRTIRGMPSLPSTHSRHP